MFVMNIAQTPFTRKIICNKIFGVITFLIGITPNSLSFNNRLSFRKRQCAYHSLLDHTSSVSVLRDGWCSSARLLLSASCACCTPRLWMSEITCKNSAVLCILGNWFQQEEWSTLHQVWKSPPPTLFHHYPHQASQFKAPRNTLAS